MARPRRGALGLRGRIVGAVLVTTVATLAVAAVAVLGPLEHELKSAALHTLQKDLGKNAMRAFLTNHRISSFGSLGGTEYARLAVPLTIGGQRYVLAVRKPIEDIPGAVHVVRTAFLYAALAGLALTLILGIPLAATLVRRL